MIIRRLPFLSFLAPLVTGVGVAFTPVAPFAPLVAGTAAVAVVEFSAPAEAKPKWQAFVGPKNGTRRAVKADSLKSLKDKVLKRSGKFATQGVQNLSTGQWRPAPYKGKPAIDQFNFNLYQIR